MLLVSVGLVRVSVGLVAMVVPVRTVGVMVVVVRPPRPLGPDAPCQQADGAQHQEGAHDLALVGDLDPESQGDD